MTRTSAHALAVARPVIQGLTLLNALYALALAGLLVSSFFIEGWPQRPLGFDLVNAHPLVGHGVRAIVVVGVIGAAIVHTILRRLLAIVDTVRVGDPFILENARRLNAIAWSVAGAGGAAAGRRGDRGGGVGTGADRRVLVRAVAGGAAAVRARRRVRARRADARRPRRHGVTWRSLSASTRSCTSGA